MGHGLAPEEPSAAAIMCVDDEVRSMFDLDIYFGVDKQVVADQINDKLVPLGSVGTGSGGSVGLGAGALGSLASGDDGGQEVSQQE